MIFNQAEAEITGIQTYRNNQQFVTSDAEGKILLWTFQGEVKKLISFTSKINTCVISEDNQYLYIALDKDFQILKINLFDQKVEVEFQKSHLDSVFALKILYTGQRLISGGADKRIILWSTQTGQILGEFYEGHLGSVQDLFITKNMQTLFSTGRDCQIVKWNINGFSKQSVFEWQHNEWISSIILDSQERFLYSGGGDKCAIKWDQEQGKMIGKYENSFQDKILCISVTNCGRYLITCDFNGMIFIWNQEEFWLVKVLEKHQGKIRCVKVAQNDTTLITGSVDKTIKIWQLDFINSLSKLQQYFENKEFNMGVDQIKSNMQINKSFNDLLEFFFISNNYSQQIDKIIAQKIEQLIKEMFQSFSKQKPEIQARISKGFLIFYWKLIAIVQSKNKTSQIIQRFSIEEYKLENILEKYKFQNEEIFKLQSVLNGVQKDCQYLEFFIQKQTTLENKETLYDQIKQILDQIEKPEEKIFTLQEGKIESGLKQGFFKEQNISGEYFEGMYKDGKRHGSGFLKTDFFHFEGEFEFDIPLLSTGTILHYDENKKAFKKQFKDILNYRGEFKEKKFHGKGTIYFRNSGHFEGTFADDEIDQTVLGTLTVYLERGRTQTYPCFYAFFQNDFLGWFTSINETFSVDFKDGFLFNHAIRQTEKSIPSSQSLPENKRQNLDSKFAKKFEKKSSLKQKQASLEELTKFQSHYIKNNLSYKISNPQQDQQKEEQKQDNKNVKENLMVSEQNISINTQDLLKSET